MIPDLEDDDELGLPPLPPIGGSEETGVGDDVGVELDFGGEETIGLDDAEGIEDFDVLELLELDALGEAGLENESAGDLVGGLETSIDGDGGDEYGWTRDTETVSADEWDDTPLIEEPDDWGEDDGGELGLDESPLVEFTGDDEPVGLPALQRDDEEGYADDLDLEEDGQIELPNLSFEQEVRLMGSDLPPPMPARTKIAVRGAVYAIAFGRDALWAAGDDLHRIDAQGPVTPKGEGLEPEDMMSVAAFEQTVVVGTRLGGVFRSDDGGNTFEPINSWRSGGEPSVGCRVVFDRAGRLWMWAGGALYRSRDLGSRWTGPVLPSPVVDITLDDGRVVALCLANDQLEVLRCRDDGLAFEALTQPVPRGEGELRLGASGKRVLLARDGDVEGPALWTGEGWVRCPELSGAHLAYWIEGRPVGAVHIAGRDRGVVVAGGGSPAVLVDLIEVFGATPPGLREVGADQRVHAILLDESNDRLWVASGVGLVSVTR